MAASDSLDHNEVELELNDSGVTGNINNVEYKEEAIQLIKFEDKGFKLNPEALDIISSIEEDLVVVAVIGKARTGKSYLMNLMLDNIGKNKGFQVDSKISSCTKGIWMWGNHKKSLTGGNTRILFIDSEGTSATDRGTKTYDSRIFALVVLISSLFIYNTTSNIDEHGISELSLAAHLSNAISTNSNIDKENLLTELSPKFIWVLRDFTLEKVHPETGQEITSKEYLEICLRKKISGKNSNDNNLIRNNIIKYFPERDCVTLVRPVESESELQRLNNIPFEKLKPNFKLEFKALKDKIFRETLPKKFNGKKLNGPALANLIVEFVSAINTGAIPNINNSWDSVIQKDIKDYFHKAISHFKLKTNKLSKKIFEMEDLFKQISEIKLESQMIYNKLLQLNYDTFADINYMNLFNVTKKTLEEEIKKIEEKIEKDNSESASNNCKEVLKSEFKEINKKMFDHFYTSKYVDEFNEDCVNFLNRYATSEKVKGANKLNHLVQFLTTNEKAFITYFVNALNKENESKMNKIDKNIREDDANVEDLENQNKNLLEVSKTKQNRINNLEKNIGIEERHIDDLKERLENLNKELELVVQSEDQKATYKPDEKSKRKEIEVDKPNLEDIVANVDRRKNAKGEKKESCHCNCLIF